MKPQSSNSRTPAGRRQIAAMTRQGSVASSPQKRHGLSNMTIAWLLEGDAAIQYQVRRDLLGEDPSALAALQQRITAEGWGARFLAHQRPDGHWGRSYYQPKWTSTHYTLLDIRNLEPPQDLPNVRSVIGKILAEMTGPDGGVYFSPSFRDGRPSDVCVNAMFLNVAAYFQVTGLRLREIADLLLACRMGDFGWNCDPWAGATHSSMHTTISVLEGLTSFTKADPLHRTKEVTNAVDTGVEFLLAHELYKSHRTGRTIDDRFLMLSYPCRYRYDILRALDWCAKVQRPYDVRMKPALEVLAQKRRTDGTWPLQHKHSGSVHFDMENPRQPSRWNTLRAARVMAVYGGMD